MPGGEEAIVGTVVLSTGVFLLELLAFFEEELDDEEVGLLSKLFTVVAGEETIFFAEGLLDGVEVGGVADMNTGADTDTGTDEDAGTNTGVGTGLGTGVDTDVVVSYSPSEL